VSAVSEAVFGRSVVTAEPGFGPQWWSSGTRTWVWWTAGTIAYTLVLVDAVFQLRNGALAGPLALNVAGELAEITVGLLFWMWRRNLIGPLIVTYVVVYLLQDLTTLLPHSRLAVTIWYPINWWWQPLWVWMLLAFPSGRLWNRACAWLIVYMAAFLTFVPAVQEFFDPGTYLYVGHGWSGLHLYDRWSYGISAILIWLPFTVFAVARIVRTAPGARRRFVPLYVASAYLVLVILPLWTWFYLTTKSFNGWVPANAPAWYWNYAGTGCILLLSAAGAAFGLARVRQKRSSVADLVVELGRIEPGRVRETLARTLGDPSLQLGLWLPERRVWVDEEGLELALSTPDDGRAVTYVGDRLAVMIHHPDLLDQPRLLEAVGSAGRLALENERLQAELRAQLRELQASRARIVRTADEERRRLERDLHDGAQQRLLGLGMGLQLLTSHADDHGRRLLSDVQHELDEALRELRELARGIHPAVLTDQGLAAAVRTLAQRASIPVTVTSVDERAPAHVETAAYFVVSEALANIAKYAHASRATVDLARDNGNLRVEIADDGVGGASLDAGSGLTGLADRVGALGGRLSLDSPTRGGTRLTAQIPCGDAAA
jgi:signal transduction histidine kinase